MEGEMKILLDLVTALGIGLLIGLERGWKGRAKEEGDRVAGIRTFALTGLLGGVMGLLSESMGEWLLPAAFLSFTIMVAVSYFVGVRSSDDVGFTTSVALLITFSLGVWASFGNHVSVFAVAVMVVTLLGYKPEIHRLVHNIEEREIYAGIKLLVISVILLPLLPDQGYGPFEALNPYWLWWMVVLITGLSFIGYLTISYLGDKIGVLLTALTGGLASSTAVTLSLANMAKRTRVSGMFMAGVLIASSIMFFRVGLEVSVVNTRLLQMLWPSLLAMLVVNLAGMLWFWLLNAQKSKKETPSINIESPFQMKTALKFALLLGIILVLSEAMKDWLGDEGIYILSVISGLMDVDAITLSLSKMAKDELSEDVAVRGIIIATATNNIIKGFIFSFITRFKPSARLILVLAVSGAAGLLVNFVLA